MHEGRIDRLIRAIDINDGTWAPTLTRWVQQAMYRQYFGL